MRLSQCFAAMAALALAGAVWAAPVSGQNLVANGSFDSNLDNWTFAPASSAYRVAWSKEDADGSPLSGSATVTFAAEYGDWDGESVANTRILIEANRTYELRARVRVAPGQTGVGHPVASLWWQEHGGYDDEGQQKIFPMPTEGGGWTTVSVRFQAPATFLRAYLFLGMAKQPNSGELSVQFDDVTVHAVADLAYLVPGVAHTHGVNGAYWVSDLTVFNPGSDPAQVELSFKGNNEAGPIQRTIAGRQQLSVDDVLASAFGITGEDAGVITVSSSTPVETHVRTYARGVDSKTGAVKTYGQSYPGMEPSQALPGLQLGFLTGLRSDGAYRSNLELVNAGDQDATASVRFFDASGASIGGDLSRTVTPGQRVGITSALPEGHPSAYAELRLSPPEAKVIAFGSVIDGNTNDPTTVPLTPGPAVSDLDGTWAGPIEVFPVETVQHQQVSRCAADYLRNLISGGGQAQVTISGTTLTVDAVPAFFGACGTGRLVESYGDLVLVLSCDFGLPRDITCSDGTTRHLSLAPGGAGVNYDIGKGTPDSISFGLGTVVLASPGNETYDQGFSLIFVFHLSGKH
jgi:hypothetical protein